MSRLDVIVFGATGFTGKLVIEHLVKLCQDEYKHFSWGLAGRSKDKLITMLQYIKESGIDTTNIPILVADVKDENSLLNMTEKTKVLMNCTGPYTLLGEPVVKACISTRTHYLDISAELHFMLETYRKYHEIAEESRVLIIPACGYGSIPAAMGMVKLEKEFKGSLSTVECYSALHIPKRLYFPGCNKTLVHYGTWDSLVYELQNFREYSEQRKKIFPVDIYKGEKIERSFFHKRNGKFWFPYPGPDDDVVDMSQRYLYEKRKKTPVRFNSYTTMPSLFHLFLLVPAFFFYYYASILKCFRKLLRRYPRFFTAGYMSHAGPSKRNRNDLKFSFVLNGKGLKDGEHRTEETRSQFQTLRISGVDPYAMTAITFILSAITVIEDEKQMPKGGVIPIGAAFFDTSLVDRLSKNGLVFDNIENIM